MAAPYHHLTETFFPPMGMGASYLLPSLAVCIVCLAGILVLWMGATAEGRRRMAPIILSILSLSVILSAMMAWSFGP